MSIYSGLQEVRYLLVLYRNRKRSRSGSLMPSLLNSKSPIGGRRGSRMLDEGVGDFGGMLGIEITVALIHFVSIQVWRLKMQPKRK